MTEWKDTFTSDKSAHLLVAKKCHNNWCLNDAIKRWSDVKRGRHQEAICEDCTVKRDEFIKAKKSYKA